MDGDSLFSCLIIICLLFMSGYLSMSETAFASVSRVRLKSLCEHGDSRAKKARYVTENFNKAITTLLIANNIVNLTLAAYITVLVTRRWGVSFVTVSTIVTTLVVFLIGEMLPKSMGKRYSERVALSSAGTLCFFMRVFAPVSAVLTAIGNAAAKLTKGDPEVSVTEDELYDLIETMTDDGELSEERGELVQSAMSFGEVCAENIVTARVDIAAIDIDWPPERTLEFIKQVRHSRLPVYQGSVDNIIGILQIKKYIKAYLDGEAAELKKLLDEPFYVHASTMIDELLREMSERKCNIAVVTDNFGGTLGIVTVEDILEELVGEIWDEDDVVVEPCVKLADGSYSFQADVEVEDAFDFMDYESPDAYDFEHISLGQWAYEQLDGIPVGGESFAYNDLTVIVQDVENRRIRTLRIERSKEAGEAQ